MPQYKLPPYPKRVWIVDLITCLFILLFTYAAVSKLTDVQNFKTQISQSPLLTPFGATIMWVIPTIEFIIVGLLLFNKTRMTGLYFSYGLMVIFTMYIIAITQFSTFIPCSCGGILQQMTWNQHLFFNLIFVVLGIISVLIYRPRNIAFPS
ncbi:MauE/DoxX family redox-associated membrane protein [Chitinophaga sancti]|uniref:MauE/DoxX family redox-associated membrane protein n=1 Tax=Chitinophaga sancti TaxID=1004 RepID=UPI0039BE5CA7